MSGSDLAVAAVFLAVAGVMWRGCRKGMFNTRQWLAGFFALTLVVSVICISGCSMLDSLGQKQNDNGKEQKTSSASKADTADKASVSTDKNENRSPDNTGGSETPNATGVTYMPDIITPYSCTSTCDKNVLVEKGNDKYTHTYVFVFGNKGDEVTFNLKGQYKTLKMSMLIADADPKAGNHITILGDNATLGEYTIYDSDLPAEKTINVNGIKQLKIRGQSEAYHAHLVMVDPILE